MAYESIGLQNGHFTPYRDISISPDDRSVYFGDGIYEVIRIYSGKLDAFEGHLERLYRSAEKISLNLPIDKKELQAMLEELVRMNHFTDDGILYVQFSRGTAPRVHKFPGEDVAPSWFAYLKQANRPLEIMRRGEPSVLAKDIRWLKCDIKSLNLLPNVLASQKAAASGCREAILFRDEAHVTEGASSNVFIVKNGILRTHPADSFILNGITRQRVINLAKDAGFEVREEVFGVNELLEADEVFFTSTIYEISPVISVGGRTIGEGIPGEITRRLQEAYEQVVHTRRDV